MTNGKTLRTATPVKGPSYLGDLIGGSSYFGGCSDCGGQFMGTHDRVYVSVQHAHVRFCSKCVAR